jgi:hypothetical protein
MAKMNEKQESSPLTSTSGTAIEILVLQRVYLRSPANIFGEKILVTSLLISTLDKVTYYKGDFLLQGSTKPLFTRYTK